MDGVGAGVDAERGAPGALVSTSERSASPVGAEVDDRWTAGIGGRSPSARGGCNSAGGTTVVVPRIGVRVIGVTLAGVTPVRSCGRGSDTEVESPEKTTDGVG
jgi:hypothetical protein